MEDDNEPTDFKNTEVANDIDKEVISKKRVCEPTPTSASKRSKELNEAAMAISINTAEQIQSININTAEQIQSININTAEQIQSININTAEQIQSININTAEQIQSKMDDKDKSDLQMDMSNVSTNTSWLSQNVKNIETKQLNLDDIVSTGIEPLSTGIEPLSTGIEPLSTGIEPISTGIEPISTGVSDDSWDLNMEETVLITNGKDEPSTNPIDKSDSSFEKVIPSIIEHSSENTVSTGQDTVNVATIDSNDMEPLKNDISKPNVILSSIEEMPKSETEEDLFDSPTCQIDSPASGIAAPLSNIGEDTVITDGINDPSKIDGSPCDEERVINHESEIHSTKLTTDTRPTPVVAFKHNTEDINVITPSTRRVAATRALIKAQALKSEKQSKSEKERTREKDSKREKTYKKEPVTPMKADSIGDSPYVHLSASASIEREYPKMSFPVIATGNRPLYNWGKGVIPAYIACRDVLKAKREAEDAEYKAYYDQEMLKYRQLKLEYGDRKIPPTKKSPPQQSDILFEPLHKWWVQAARLKPGEELSARWSYFEHQGLVFTPPYERLGVPLIVKGREVELPDLSEELITFLCGAHNSDYVNQPTFLDNFYEGFMKTLPDDHIMKNPAEWGGELPKIGDCDYERIRLHKLDLREKEILTRKDRPAVLRGYDKILKEKKEGPYSHAIVNGLREKLQQFKTEPPSLFRGRGDHPKRGTIKWRTFPEHVTLNLSKHSPVPMLDVCLMFGHHWGEIHHNADVTWLAMYKDSVMQSQKYLFLAASSGLKGQSDFKKYEKARLLKHKIDEIRKQYNEWMNSSEGRLNQLGLATYLIDRLALRAGNDKDEQEADTVGCCSLRKEHITLDDDTQSVTFDFLGKDSIHYFNIVKIEKLPYRVFKKLINHKKDSDDVFDLITPTTLNKQLSEIADFTLSAKVFRTFNASMTLHQELMKLDPSEVDTTNADELRSFYDRSNREVAILCNHQRAVSKTHEKTTGNIKKKIMDLEDDIMELQAFIAHTKSKKKSKFKYTSIYEREDGSDRVSCINTVKMVSLEKQLATKIDRLANTKRSLEMKEENKTVATGTSKMHYMDPRITVSFCKKYMIPIEKLFQATLIKKFPWAMNASGDFNW